MVNRESTYWYYRTLTAVGVGWEVRAGKVMTPVIRTPGAAGKSVFSKSTPSSLSDFIKNRYATLRLCGIVCYFMGSFNYQ